MTDPNTPYAVRITAENFTHLIKKYDLHRMFGIFPDYVNSYLVIRPLGGGYHEMFRDVDFERIYEFVAGKYWPEDLLFGKIQQKMSYINVC